MKKHKKLYTIFLCISIIFVTLFINRYKIINTAYVWINNRLDYERSLEVGDEFNKLVWGDLTFQINHYKSGNKLDYVRNDIKTSLLSNVINYLVLDNQLYVVATDGYAVVNYNNVAKIYSNSKEQFLLENVICITSFEEFEEHEQKIFKKIS